MLNIYDMTSTGVDKKKHYMYGKFDLFKIGCKTYIVLYRYMIVFGCRG